ncbi:MAG: RHS repeat-associated core domain-containing protein [Clostridia bacterium]|nr:RHS repeat-associated core domain-containing protein [Clostridia bacterium]
MENHPITEPSPDFYDGTKLIFLYDENGDIFGLTYGNDNYYYIKNAQNDVIAIANSSGNVIASYTYDAWGKVLSITGDVAWLGQINPIRYRSYYYDNESGYYYLQSRYYNPEIGRFICADGVVSDVGGDVLGYNMFAYCFNNPVNLDDSNGNWPKWVEKVKKAVCLVLSTLILTPIVRGSKDVKKTHVKEEIPIVDGGVIFGGVSLTITTTEEDEEPGLFYKFDDDGNDSSSTGFGVNNNKRSEVGYSDEGNVFSNTQILPFVHVGASLGIDGVGGLIGLDIGNTAIDLEGKVGWGTLLLFPAVVTVLFLCNSGEGNRTPVRQY